MRKLYAFLFLVSWLPLIQQATAQVQSVDHDSLEIVDYFTAYEHSFRCDFSKAALAELSAQSDQEIEANLNAEIQNAETALQEAETSSEKKLLRHQVRVLNKLLKTSRRKESLENFYQALCHGSEFVVSKSAKALAHSANVIGQTLTLPVRFVYRFFKGLSTGKVSDDPQLTLYGALGKIKYQSIAFYGLYASYKAVLASNPYTIPLFLTPMADYLVMSICESKTTLRPDEFRFCSNYEGVKNRFFRIAKMGEKWGASLSRHQADATKKKTPWIEKITDQNVCEYLQLIHDEKTNSEKWIEFKKVMLLLNNPGHYSHPEEVELKTDDTLMRKTDATSMASLRNVIISLAPREGAQDEAYLAKMKRLKRLKRIFSRMYRSSSKEQCESKKKQNGFNFQEFEKLKEEIASDRLSGYAFQHQLVEKQIKAAKGRFRFFNKTKLNWEVIPVDTLNQVHGVLRSRDVANVILIAHTEGTYQKLVDSTVAQYPTTFFSDLSPTLLSLSFYSCHSERVLKTFNLKEKLAASPTIHAHRKMYFAEDGNMLDGYGSPLAGFGDFLVRVDHDIFPLMQGSLLSQSLQGKSYVELSPEKQCRVTVGKVKVDHGTLSVIVNRRFVGTINRDDTSTEFEFPCAFLDRDENVVLLQNHALLEKLLLSQNEFSPVISGADVKLLSSDHFTDPDSGDYSSSKFIFIRK